MIVVHILMFGRMNIFVGCSVTSRNIKQWEELCSSPASGNHSGAPAGGSAAWQPAPCTLLLGPPRQRNRELIGLQALVSRPS